MDIIAGVVDIDTYASLINFPFFATAADGVHTLAKGTPLVQVIPFRRDDAAAISSIGKLGDDRLALNVAPKEPVDSIEREKIRRNTLSIEGWYRRFSRAKR